MGISNEVIFFNVTKDIKPHLFINSQLHWGHKKTILNPKLSVYILGFNNGFSVINFEYSVEFFKKSLSFCFDAISSTQSPSILLLSTKSNYRKLIFFFAARCFQMVFSQKWIHGFMTKNLINMGSILISPKLDRNLIAETLKLLHPMICIEDSNYRVNRTFYSIPGNDDSKKGLFVFYTYLTNALLKYALILHYKNINY